MFDKLEKIYLDLFNTIDEYKLNKDSQLNKFEAGLTNQNLNNLLKEIKDSDVDNIVIVMDSYKDISHPHKVKAIIDTNLKEETNTKTFFIPSNSNNKDDFIKKIEAIEKIMENNQDKKVFINQSFSNDIIKETFEANFNNISPLKDSYLIKRVNEDNKDLIDLLNKYPNLTIVKSAGNNIEKGTHKLNDYLKVAFDKLTNNDYNTMKDISLLLNHVLKKAINGEDISLDVANIEKEFKPLFEEAKLSYNNFISLYINDFLVHYDAYSALEQSKNLKNNNLNIVEAFDESKILENYVAYKDYHKKEIPELEDYFTFYKKYKIDYSYSKEEINELKKLHEKHKDTYPEIFKISTFGTFSNLEHHNNETLKFAPHKHDTSGFLMGNGTSFAAPELLSDLVKENKINQQDINLENNNI